MKFLAVFLATLVIFTGSQASSPSNEPKLSHKSISYYLSTFFERAADNMESIRNSEMGQEINTLLTDGINRTRTYMLEVQKQLPPAVQPLMEKMTADVQEMTRKVQPFLDNLTQKAGDLAKEVLLGRVEERVAPQLESHAENLGATILEGVAPYALYLRDWLLDAIGGSQKTPQ